MPRDLFIWHSCAILRAASSSESPTCAEQGLVARVRARARQFRTEGVRGDGELQVGLKPSGGWGRRNWKFVGEVLVPEYFRARSGATRESELPQVADDQIGVVWIGHATFLIQIGGKRILVDPNWAKWLGVVKRVRHPGLHLEDLPPIDAVMISHAHYDHLHVGSLRRIATGQPVVVPRGVGSIVQRRGFSHVVELDHWQTVDIDDVSITLTLARHWGARNVHDTHRGFGGFVIEAGGGCVFHCGDSAYFDGIEEIGDRFPDIDIAMMPIGAYGSPSGREVHMDPEQALEAFERIGAAGMVPMHYGTFPLGTEPMGEPLERLKAAALERGLDERVLVLPEGELLIS